LRNWNSYRINAEGSYLALIPIHLHFFHIKLRCIRMLWFSIMNIVIFGESIVKICRQGFLTIDKNCFFFVTEEFHKKTHSPYIYLLMVLIPSISIDMSYFYKNNKNEKVSWED
jgi:hypothetical protein